MSDPRIDHYDWEGGREAMLRFGPDTGPIAILALPLFEEANRTRTFGVRLLRELAARGVAGVLPDLPGQGESLVPLGTMTILRMQTAYDAVVDAQDRPCVGIGIRSGALLDALGLLVGRWLFAPQGGPALLRELTRVRRAAGARASGDWWHADEGPFDVGGNLLSVDLLTELLLKEPFDEPGIPRRTVRLATDPLPADRKVDAAPLWRRVEPSDDPALAQMLADDIVHWIATCGG